MKKKNIKNALLCAALAVPTMFLATGCKDKQEPISVDEYSNLVYDAGSNYIRNHSDYKTYGDMTVNSQKTMSNVAKREVEYKANAEATELSEKEVSITSKTTQNQVIEINRDETENGDIAIKITKTSVSEEKGERPNQTTQLLENYENKTDASEVYTFVKNGEAYKLYKHTKRTVKATGEDDDTYENKAVMTYATQELFQSAIEDVLEEVNDDLVDSLLSCSGEILFMSPDTYKQGDDNFGLTFKYSDVGLEDDRMIKSDMETKLEYRDNLPYSVTSTNKGVSMDGDSMEMIQSATITYSAPAIAAPTDSADYTEGIVDTSNVITGMGGY